MCCACSFTVKGVGASSPLRLGRTLEMTRVLEGAAEGPSLVSDLWSHLLLGFVGAALSPFFLPFSSSLLPQSLSGARRCVSSL